MMKVCYINGKFANVHALRLFLKEEVEIRIDPTGQIKETEFYIANENEYKFRQEDIVAWDEQFLDFYKYVMEEWSRNYEGCYIQNALRDAKESPYEAVVVGSSYARFGVEEKLLDIKCKNLALSSQDLYYACKIAKDVCEQNRKVKKVILGCSYYYFYSDLSREKNRQEALKITNVYYPLYHDIHNAHTVYGTASFAESDVWNMKKIFQMLSEQIYHQNKGEFYIQTRSREMVKQKLWEKPEREWKEISTEEKLEAGLKRAGYHNKCIKYHHTYLENQMILEEFLEYCKQRSIEFWICVFPMTESYTKNFLNDFKEKFYDVLESSSYPINLMDLNDDMLFSDEDFVDTDHLNESGARKATDIINQYIR